ncbi:MAG: hypothetical protein MPEBLZ_03116 [Candidatus Methanoperedens nitroreducens]|uniref:Uncharacterized protein n=1 Tax=Candidatus Methanoperedens nitratireducens TaxID=1392998 RepID=A0A0P8A2L3_9EURY|nr:MAG: hypothetical protein MPEBLZ_03116 [Candidatus Methanoperedens sp. BLZ1]CAG0961508.1 hypothetical protein METP2_00820 [Methanosarcinales archaeon]
MTEIYPTSFKMDKSLKERLDKYNAEHPETPLKLNIFLNSCLTKWLESKKY